MEENIDGFRKQGRIGPAVDLHRAGPAYMIGSSCRPVEDHEAVEAGRSRFRGAERSPSRERLTERPSDAKKPGEAGLFKT
jgi:hypothetical protein